MSPFPQKQPVLVSPTHQIRALLGAANIDLHDGHREIPDINIKAGNVRTARTPQADMRYSAWRFGASSRFSAGAHFAFQKFTWYCGFLRLPRSFQYGAIVLAVAACFDPHVFTSPI